MSHPITVTQTFDLDEIDAVSLGEMLREYLFVPKPGSTSDYYGCYTTFLVRDDALGLFGNGGIAHCSEKEYSFAFEQARKYFEVPDLVYPHDDFLRDWNGIEITAYQFGWFGYSVEAAWYWDGDGDLVFWIRDMDGNIIRQIENCDCKKANYWQDQN